MIFLKGGKGKWVGGGFVVLRWDEMESNERENGGRTGRSLQRKREIDSCRNVVRRMVIIEN